MFERLWEGEGHLHAVGHPSERSAGVRRAGPALQRDLPVLTAAFVGAVLFTGCVPQYQPPTASEPHAVLKLRRSYEKTPGQSLREQVEIDEHSAYDEVSAARLGSEALTDAVLMHPAPSTVRVATSFFHIETRRVLETYTEQVPQSYMESYDCSSGFGTNRSYRTCTRPGTRYESRTKTRWVTKSVPVDDGSCEQSVGLSATEGKVYLIQYTYRDRGVCSLSCFEQVPSADGTFTNQPCPGRAAR